MSDARERLTRLIDLASESAPEKRRALAFELCDLLSDWPERYPPAMREPFEALLENVLRRLDGTTRRLIIARLARHPETSSTLLYEFYFDAPAETRREILQRDCEAGPTDPVFAAAEDEIVLVETARMSGSTDFVGELARFLAIPTRIATHILEDATGDALGVACKGARVRRAVFSALAVLKDRASSADARYERLASYETIPQKGAIGLLAHWQRVFESAHKAEPDAHAA